MVSWAKENAAASGLSDAPIRWLVDDCIKFVEREIRRGNTYDGIIMDPPSYGRALKGNLENQESIFPFVQLCAQLLSRDARFFLINSYHYRPAARRIVLYDESVYRPGSGEDMWMRKKSAFR